VNAASAISPVTGESGSPESDPVRFAVVEAGMPVTKDRAPIELVLASGDRLRIAPGADAATLRTVLSILPERA
jgi:hypothetical protein